MPNKNTKFLSADAPTLDSRAGGGWRRFSQILETAPHCRFLATRLSLIMLGTANFYATRVHPDATF